MFTVGIVVLCGKSRGLLLSISVGGIGRKKVGGRNSVVEGREREA